ncbi:MAG: hypothetical protein VB058_03525, partial [Oscillospiraceae bacterium]|nr:hypothetical protein [Oscillospiraceae bacterium]
SIFTAGPGQLRLSNGGGHNPGRSKNRSCFLERKAKKAKAEKVCSCRARSFHAGLRVIDVLGYNTPRPACQGRISTVPPT